MSLLPITLYGDKILRKITNPIKDIDIETVELIKNMHETMKNASGIGLAANQVGSDKSIFVVDISLIEGYEDHKPMVLINPEILEKSDEQSVIEEGCLSIPEVRFEISRPEKILINFFDTNMKEHQLEADDILARVMQHEFDHLKGILFTDLLDEKEFKKVKVFLNRIKKRKLEVEYPVSENMDYRLM